MKTNPVQILFHVTKAAARPIALGALILGMLASPGGAVAQTATNAPPDRLSYQGYLVDANGNPLAPTTPANFTVVFRIWTAANGGSRLWSEQQIVTVDKGNFSVALGEGSQYLSEARPPLGGVLANSANASDRYIGINVTINGTPTEILPRLRLLPTPYAFLSTSARNLTAANGSTVVTHTNNRVEITGNLLASGTISGSGSGLSGLSASSITAGTLSDDRLSGNIARLNVGNTFTASQRFNSLVGINTAPGTWLDINGNFRVANANGSFLWNGYDPGAGTVLLSVLTGANNNGPQFRFTGPAGGGFADIGQNGAGSFVIEQNDAERLVVTSAGNVGIGTSTPSAKLDVRGDVKMGSSGQYLATGSTENLRIVRGIIRADGTIFNGGGFTATRLGVGSYRLTWNPAFADVPAVTLTPDGGEASWNPISTTGCDYQTRNSAGAAQDHWVTVIAIGAR